jgi:signal transduction histidine kinase
MPEPSIDAADRPDAPVLPGSVPDEIFRTIGVQLEQLQVVDPAAALKLAEASLRDPRWSGNPHARCHLLMFSAMAMRRMNRSAEAEDFVIAAIEAARSTGDAMTLGKVLLTYANLLVALGRFVAASEVASQVLEMDLVRTDPLAAMFTLDCLADLSAALGWYERARQFNSIALVASECRDGRTRAMYETEYWRCRCEYTVWELLDQRHNEQSSGWAATVDRFDAEFVHAMKRSDSQTIDSRPLAIEHLQQLVRWVDAECQGRTLELDALAAHLCAQPSAPANLNAGSRLFARALAEARLGHRDQAHSSLEACLALTPRGMPALRQSIFRALAQSHAEAGHWKQAHRARLDAEAERRACVDERVRQHAVALTDRLQRDRAMAQALLSNDLRARLAAISSLASRPPGADAAVSARDRLVQAHALARQALDQTERYLRCAHLKTLQSAQLELLVLPEVLADAVDELSLADAAHQPAVKVTVVTGEGDDDTAQAFLVHGHYTSLRRVFMELLTLAAQRSPAGGAIEVTVRRDESNVLVTIRSAGDGLPLDELAVLTLGHHQHVPLNGTVYVAEAVRTMGGHIFAANPDEGGAVVVMSFARA